MKNSYDEIILSLYEHYFGEEEQISRMTLQEAFDLWYEKKEAHNIVSSMTLIRYKADWKHFMCGVPSPRTGQVFVRSALLNRPIAAIKPHEIRDLYESLAGNGSKITKQSFYNLRGLIIGAFSHAFNLGVSCIDASRVSYDDLHFREPKVNSSDVYTPEERDRLLSYLESLDKQDCYTLSVRLMFTLCIRIGELRALTWGDIDDSDPEHPYLLIRHQIVDKRVDGVGRKATDVDYMKSHSRSGKRRFPLSTYTLQVLDEFRDLCPEGKYICSNQGGENSIYTNRFNEHLKKYCEGAGIRYLSNHKIRFYAVSQMYDMEVAEKDIMALAGHSNVSTTRHYNRRLKEIAMSEAQLQEGFGREFVRKPLQTSPSGKESDIAG